MTEGQQGLVGRGEEMAFLAGAIDQLGGGSSRVVHIVGEAGIGKSRLLLEAKQRAAQHGHRVFSGGATEFERKYPFGVFVDALDHHLASDGPGEIEDLGQGRVRELAGIFPSLSSEGGAEQGVSLAERFRTYDAVRALLELLGKDSPLVLTLDDLQWADAASVELLSHLLRRPPDGPVLTLLAYRPRQASPQLGAALAAAKRENPGEPGRGAIELGPLNREDCQQLLGPRLDGAAKERLYRESGGNPFYLEQLARTERRGVASVGAGGDAVDQVVPIAVAASIAGELDALPGAAGVMLRAAAVVGEPFDPGITASVAGLSDADALQALDELADLDLIRPTRVASLFRFRHPILRRAVYESAKPGWRIDAHRRAATVLRQRGASAVARADHIEQSASPGDEEAIELLTEAGHAAASRAPSAAASWFRSALRLLPSGEGNAERRVGLLVAMAVSLGAVGRLEESSSTMREVLELVPPEATGVRTGAVWFAAVLELLLANQEKADELLLGALSELPDQGSHDATRLKSGLALSSFFAADWAQMRVWSRRVLQEGADPFVTERANAVGATALAEYGLGNAPQARIDADEAAELIDGLSNEELATAPEAILFLGWSEHCLGRNLDVERHMDRAIGLARASGQGHLMASTLVVKSVGQALRGELGDAAITAEHAVESALLSSDALFGTWAFTNGCFVEMQRGNLVAAVRYGEQAVAAGASTKSPWAAMAPWHLGEAWLELGETERCRELLLGAVKPSLPPFPLYVPRSLGTLAGLALELGDLDAADGWAREAEQVAAKLGVGGQIAEAGRARATVLLAQGLHKEARAVAMSAASSAADAGARVEAARSRALAGRALAEAGDREPALEQLGRAERELAACGAQGYQEQAVRELRRLGRRVARASPQTDGHGVSDLTPRQLEVAEHVAAGMTNRQIADQLFLSEKSVERHLTRIFEKLELSSRTALTALMEGSRTPTRA